MKKRLKLFVSFILSMLLMASPVLADTPTAGESTNVGIVLQGALVDDYVLSGGRPVEKSFKAQTTTTMQASTIGVEYYITQKGNGLHANVHDYAGSKSTTNARSINLEWETVNQTEVNGAYIVYGTHTFSQYGQYFDVYTSLDF